MLRILLWILECSKSTLVALSKHKILHVRLVQLWGCSVHSHLLIKRVGLWGCVVLHRRHLLSTAVGVHRHLLRGVHLVRKVVAIPVTIAGTCNVQILHTSHQLIVVVHHRVHTGHRRHLLLEQRWLRLECNLRVIIEALHCFIMILYHNLWIHPIVC